MRVWAVPLYLGNAEELPFGDATFDSVFHIGGINFFNDKAKAIAEMIRVAKPGTRILICDENERGARACERTLPGFKRSFRGGRQEVTAPVDAVPPGVQEVRVFDVWKGWMYCLEFRKPGEASHTETRGGAMAETTFRVALGVLSSVMLLARPAGGTADAGRVRGGVRGVHAADGAIPT